MNRRKPRKARRRQRERDAGVFLRFDNAGDARVRLEGITQREYERVQALAQAGDIHDPLIMKFIRAFATQVGHDIDAHPDGWSDAATIEFLRWLEFVPEGEWTALDDLELAKMTGGGS
ncbi:hypothetical protein [Streptomyces sp. NPDC006132]|uniref:hypothetical protein n=1 Tax=Streptomyces sp. NPDC006132 TaxID=3156732 RepID=UPI0033DF98F4